MLVAVVVVSLLIGEVSTGIIVALLILLNLTLGTRQELTARASVDALAKMQVPQARVLRDGAVTARPGDRGRPRRHRPARGRRHRAGRRPDRPVGDAGGAGGRADRRERPDRQGRRRRSGRPTSALGDRTNMLFQNTSVTRGTATIVVTATGMQTQMGQIATMLTSVTRTRSPLQKELDSLTKVLGIIAWGAVARHRRRRADPRHCRRRSCCCSAPPWRSRRSRPACRRSSRACCRWAPSSWPRPRRSSRTSPTSRRSVPRARSTPTRPAP